MSVRRTLILPYVLTGFRLFLLFVTRLAQLPFISDTMTRRANEKIDSNPFVFTDDDDLDLCLYYLRTLYNVIRCSGEMPRAVLASKYVAFSNGSAHIRSTSFAHLHGKPSTHYGNSWRRR